MGTTIKHLGVRDSHRRTVRPKRGAAAGVLLAALLLGASACAAGDAGSAPEESADGSCAQLAVADGWYGDNAQRLQEMIDANATCDGATPEGGAQPMAVFDWDNTVVKNDIGDATTFWMLRNSKVLQPAGRDWATMSDYLTDEATGRLNEVCGDLADPGAPLPTGEKAGEDCAAEILSVYSEGETTDKAAAYEGFDARRIEPAYAFAAQLLEGLTPQQVTEYVTAAKKENLDAAEGTMNEVGGTEVTGWVRIYPQIKDLITTLQDAGFDVRIVSASSQPAVRIWASEVGVDADQVTGVQTLEEGGKLTSTLASCGGDAAAMPYIEGKRCFINEQLLGIPSAQAFEPAPEAQRQVFAAGDSDTDVTFVGDATGLRLAINRNKTELMCNAYANADGKWIVNPMFIAPEPQQKDVYPCATSGRIESDGTQGPLEDADGNVVPDQKDSVY